MTSFFVMESIFVLMIWFGRSIEEFSFYAAALKVLRPRERCKLKFDSFWLVLSDFRPDFYYPPDRSTP